MTDQLNVIAGLAEELCDARQHREPVYEWIGRNRKLTGAITTTQAGLLEQLRDAIYPTATLGEGSSRSIPKSAPPLHLEALSHHIAIAMNANRWTWRTSTINRGTPEANIRALVGTAATLDNETRRELASDLRRWRNWAAVMTGWANPPMTPHVPCPNCSKLSSLRIIAERRTAMCNACTNVWDDTDGTIDALAAWVNERSDEPIRPSRIGSTTIGHGGWQTRAA